MTIFDENKLIDVSDSLSQGSILFRSTNVLQLSLLMNATPFIMMEFFKTNLLDHETCIPAPNLIEFRLEILNNSYSIHFLQALTRKGIQKLKYDYSMLEYITFYYEFHNSELLKHKNHLFQTKKLIIGNTDYVKIN